MLEQLFREAMLQYTADFRLPDQYWLGAVSRYSDPLRHYHNLQHLEHMLGELETVRQLTEDWDAVLFALVYHDIIYDPHRGDNEEESAALALKQLQSAGFPGPRRERCAAHIMATKSHTVTEDGDTSLFTDADLSILGQDWPVYEQYVQAVRREYSHVPEASFRLGREGVMQRFLKMDRIYKTEAFYERYEARARENIGRELELEQ